MPEQFDVPHQIRLTPDPNGETAMAVFEIYIRTTPERLWEAITDPEQRAKYNFGAAVHSNWTVGSSFEMAAPNAGVVLGRGENLEVDPPRRLVQTMIASFSPEAEAEGPTRVT